MKRVFLVLAIGLALCAGAFAQDQHPTDKWGIGIQGGGSGGGFNGGGVDLTLKIPSVPVFWGIDLGFGSHWFGVGVSGDYYFIDKTLLPEAKLGWYLGGGVYARFTSVKGFGWEDNKLVEKNWVSLGAGARLPIGLSWHPIDLVEVYIQAVPSIGVNIPFYNTEFFDHDWIGWGIGGNLGIRFWF
jgi:hypothetical protein